jgi:transposase
MKRASQRHFHSKYLTQLFPGLSKQQVFYYRHEAHFHLQPYGGARNQKWDEEEKQEIEEKLLCWISNQPDMTMHEIVANFLAVGITISARSISRIFKRWKWSSKVPIYKQLAKYKPENLEQYLQYLDWIVSIPVPDWSKLKYLDESSFAPRGKFIHFNQLNIFLAALRRRKAMSPIGTPVFIAHTHRIDPKPLNIMSMIQLHPDAPIVPYLVIGTTTADDLVQFICKVRDLNFLVDGDFLIMDNSSVHFAFSNHIRLQQLQAEIGFSIVFLPPYSPELNPIEQIFGIIKRNIRQKLQANSRFKSVVSEAFSNITFDMILNTYVRCNLKPFTDK